MWNSCDVIKGIGITLFCFFSYTLVLYVFSIEGEWIGYYGAVLGSMISIGVIAFTLGQNKKHHKELMAEQNRKHEELVLLQINTALHTKNQERLRGVINELKNMYLSISPNTFLNYEVAKTALKKEDSGAYQLITDYMKLITSGLDVYDFIAITNKDIIDLTELSKSTNRYMIKMKILFIKHLEADGENIKNLQVCIDTLQNSEEYKECKVLLSRCIEEAQHRIDNNLFKSSKQDEQG